MKITTDAAKSTTKTPDIELVDESHTGLRVRRTHHRRKRQSPSILDFSSRPNRISGAACFREASWTNREVQQYHDKARTDGEDNNLTRRRWRTLLA